MMWLLDCLGYLILLKSNTTATKTLISIDSESLSHTCICKELFCNVLELFHKQWTSICVIYDTTVYTQFVKHISGVQLGIIVSQTGDALLRLRIQVSGSVEATLTSTDGPEHSDISMIGKYVCVL